MRILLISDANSIHTQRWAGYFKDQGYSVHIASFTDCQIEGVAVHRLPTYGLGKLGYFFAIPALRRLHKTLKPDIANAHYVTSYGFIAAAACIRPLIITAWGSDVLISPNESRVMKALVRFALKRATRITTVADHLTRAVLELGTNPDNVSTFPFGVDTDLFALGHQKLKSPSSIRIICTRNFSPIYDVATFIRALAMLRQRNLNFEAVLTGDGPLAADLKKLSADLSLEQQVIFMGHVSHQKLAHLLGEADIFVTTAHSDGNNISLNEAMACGCFPIATDIPANSQWIDHEKNGYLFQSGHDGQLADLIIKAIDNEGLREKARETNRRIVEERANWKICVQKMEAIFESVISAEGK